MSVWQNEEEFMTNMDHMLSEFYVRNKQLNAPNKLNEQSSPQDNSTSPKVMFDKPWYESDSDDEVYSFGRGRRPNEATKCPPGMEPQPINTIQMMQDIRTQVRNVVGDRYCNESLEKFYRVKEDDLSTNTNVPGELILPTEPKISITREVRDEHTGPEKFTEGNKPTVADALKSSLRNSNTGNSSNPKNKTSGSREKKNNRNSSRYQTRNFRSALPLENSYSTQFKKDFPPL